MENNILKHRQMVQQRINKSFGVEIEKAENELDIEKARSGIYADNAKNRRLNRVGQKYGNSKQQESGGNNAKPVADSTAKKDDSSNNIDEMKQKLSEYKEELTKKTEYLDKLVDASYDDPDDNKRIADMHRKIRSIKGSIKELEEKIESHVSNMTDSELIKKFKIPEAVLSPGDFSSHSKDFLNKFRKMVEKYGDPVKITTREFSNKWVDGEIIGIKFKTKDGKDVVLDNLKYGEFDWDYNRYWK